MKISKLPHLIAALLFLCLSAEAFSQTSLFSYEAYISEDGDTLKYRRLISDYDGISQYPLVIFLHGSGERGSDNEVQLKWGVSNFANDDIMKSHRPIVIAPQCPSGMSWDNSNEEDSTMKPEPSLPMKLLRGLISETLEKLPVDSNRIYITGLSMGGYGTYDAMMRYPEVFAAAVPVCGDGDLSKAADIAHIPIWIFHGARDGVVNPVLSQKMVDALTKAGAHPGYTQYPETGHFAWVAAYSDAMMMEWLFSQHK
ncbi:prolyl oligopeptidase family serine peptidase [Cryomorphaceae bacterium 1068]|nr:prolyl oligopeptidase family serine peptidase [Cryomorphaceae bacterium 1068]